MLTMRKSLKRNLWQGKVGNLKVILDLENPDPKFKANGVIVTPEKEYHHAFFGTEPLEKMLRFTVQGWTHVANIYPEYRQLMADIKNDKVEWLQLKVNK